MAKPAKKVFMSAVAAGFLLGGAGLLNVPTANANPYINPGFGQPNAGFQGGMGGNGQGNWNGQGQFHSPGNWQQSQQQPNPKAQMPGLIDNQLIAQVASILDVEEATVREALKEGKTLVEIAADYDVSEDTLLEKLEELQSEAIDEALEAGTITEEQAEAMNENLAERLKQIVEQAGLSDRPSAGFGQGGPRFHGAPNDFGGNNFGGHQLISGIISNVADILDVEEATVREALKEGKTLVEIAADYDVSEDTLLEKLEELQSEAIDEALEAGTITEEQAETMKEQLAERLEQMVENSWIKSGDAATSASTGATSLNTLNGFGFTSFGIGTLADVADILDVDAETIVGRLEDGDTLVEIAADYSVSEDTLLEKLEELQSAAIDEAAEADTITDSLAEKLKDQLAERLEEIVEIEGMDPSYSFKTYYNASSFYSLGLNVIADVADILDVDAETIVGRLEDGDTLVEIAADYDVSEDTLLEKLEDLQSDAIDEAAEADTITDSLAEKLKDQLAERLEDIVEASVE